MNYRTLVLIGDAEQSVMEEAERITSYLNAELLFAPIRKRELLAKSGKYDVLWCIGHADDAGFWLGADEVLSSSDLISLCKLWNCRLVVLNACSTELIARRLNYEAGCDVVAVAGEVKSHEALSFGVIFARKFSELLAAEDWDEALERAFYYAAGGGARREYLLLSRAALLRHVTEEYSAFNKRLRNVERKLEEMERMFWFFGGGLLAGYIALVGWLWAQKL